MLGGGKVKRREGYVGDRKKKRGRCTWMVEKKGKEKKEKRGNIPQVHRRIKRERNRMRMDGILEVVKKIK